MAKKTNQAVEKEKRLEEYVMSRPEQLDFFQLLSPGSEKYSHLIAFYDFIPKHFWGKAKRVEGKYLDALEREFEYKDEITKISHKYKVSISPAKIKDKDGVSRDYYPGLREALVEDALRKIAVQNKEQGIFLDNKAAVIFNIYQIQEELKDCGHTYDRKQIIDALMICAKASIEVRREDGSAILVSHIFEEVMLQPKEEWKGSGRRARCYVIFNRMVTEMIQNYRFRQFNYDKSMSLKNVIAWQLYRRMSHHYKQAGKNLPYHIKLSTMIRDFGLKLYPRLRDNLHDAEEALKIMRDDEGVIASFQTEKILDAAKPGKIVDAKFILIPGDSFISDTINANHRAHLIEAVQEMKSTKLPKSRQ